MDQKNECFREWCQRMESEPPHLERDGTAIDWDTECLATPLDFYAGEWVFIALMGLALLLGAAGVYMGWLAP